MCGCIYETGWYRYDSRFAIPVYSDCGELEKANIFKARLLIRHAASGKKYLYDILEIKKKRASPVRHKPYPIKTHFLRRIIARIFRFVNGKGRI